MRIPGELSATLMIQYADPAQRDIELRKLLGLERHLWIVAGDRRELARFDTRQMEAERISSVQFFREPAQLPALARAASSRSNVSIPIYSPALRFPTLWRVS